jgi:hypothetical protein
MAPNAKTKSVLVRGINKDLMLRLRAQAEPMGLSINQLCLLLLQQPLNAEQLQRWLNGALDS